MGAKINPAEVAKLVEGQSNKRGLPPVNRWNPPYCGEIDIRIDADGAWFHEGDPIPRHTLVQLFSSILRRDDDGHHYLVTPIERWRIQVDDAPFVIVDVDEVERDGQRLLSFTTHVGDEVLLDADHPLLFRDDQEAPYLRVRDRLDGRINRAVYYRLAELAQQQVIDGQSILGVNSGGEFFQLGEC